MHSIADPTLGDLADRLVLRVAIRTPVSPESAASMCARIYGVRGPLSLSDSFMACGSLVGGDVTCHWLPDSLRGMYSHDRKTASTWIILNARETTASAKVTLFHETGELLFDSLRRIWPAQSDISSEAREIWCDGFACCALAPSGPFLDSFVHLGCDLERVSHIWGFSQEEASLRLTNLLAEPEILPRRERLRIRALLSESDIPASSPDVPRPTGKTTWQRAARIAAAERNTFLYDRFPWDEIPDWNLGGG